MPNIIYEHHRLNNSALPFIFHTDSVRTTSVNWVNWHDNTEFLCCIEGEGTVNCNSTRINMACGDTISINARCLHSVTSNNNNVRYHCLIIDNSFFSDNGIDIQNINFNERITDSHICELMQNIADCITSQHTELYVTEMRILVLNFMYYITKHHSRKLNSSQKIVSKSHNAVLEAIAYINNNFSRKISLDEIAACAGFSKYHFARIFRQNTGLTIIGHINARRCDTASFLLRETELPINQIGFDCGFESPSYFAKAFSASYGMSPSEYRQRFSKFKT